MDWSALTCIQKPAVEPVTLDQAKNACRISHNVDNWQIERWISASRREAEKFQRRAYIAQIWEQSWDRIPHFPVCLARPPLMAVQSIVLHEEDGSDFTVYSRDISNLLIDPESTTTEAPSTTEEPVGLDNFIIDCKSEPGRIEPVKEYKFPAIKLRSINAFSVRFLAGYGLGSTAVPDEVISAILLYCGTMNEQRGGEGGGKFPEGFYDLLCKSRSHA